MVVVISVHGPVLEVAVDMEGRVCVCRSVDVEVVDENDIGTGSEDNDERRIARRPNSGEVVKRLLCARAGLRVGDGEDDTRQGCGRVCDDEQGKKMARARG